MISALGRFADIDWAVDSIQGLNLGAETEQHWLLDVKLFGRSSVDPGSGKQATFYTRGNFYDNCLLSRCATEDKEPPIAWKAPIRLMLAKLEELDNLHGDRACSGEEATKFFNGWKEGNKVCTYKGTVLWWSSVVVVECCGGRVLWWSSAVVVECCGDRVLWWSSAVMDS